MLGIERERAAGAAIVLLGAALRFTDLGAESFTNDEMYSVHFVESYTPVELLARYPTIDPHPPLYYLLLDAWTGLVGTTELLARFPAAVFGVGTVAATYLLGRRLFDGRVGLVSALFVALSTLHVYHAQEVRMYSLVTLLTVLSFYSYAGTIDSPSRRRVAGYVAATVLLLYTHVFGAFVVLAQVLFLVIHEREAIAHRDWDRITPWAVAYVILGLVYAPLVALVVRQVFLIRESGIFISWIEEPSVMAVPRAFLTYVGYQPETVILLVRAVPFLVLATVALAVPILTALNRTRWRETVPALNRLPTAACSTRSWGTEDEVRPNWTVMLAVWVVTVHVVPWVLSYVVTPVYVARYTISASLGAFLLAGVGLWTLVDRIEWGTIPDRSVALAIVGILVIGLAVPLGGYYGEHQRDQWRDAVEYVDSRADGNDAVLVLSDSPELADLSIVYRYYADRSAAEVVPIGSKDERYYDRVASMPASYDRIWLVVGLSHSVTDAERERFAGIVGEDCPPGDERRYSGVTVRSFDC